ncbi:hypothetical protein ACWESM_35155 [Nocardia sp. NPDC003999]
MRKYETEIGVSLVVVPQIVGRQRDLERMNIPREPSCHLYVVTETPRVLIPPSTVMAQGSLIAGEARRQVEDSFESCEFRFKYIDGSQLQWNSEYPYEDYSIIDISSNSTILSANAHETIAHGSEVADEWCEHNVLYVGQAFGRAGERQAFDRLRSHSTLQRIYAERRPDKEVWLSLCAITDVAILYTSHPSDHGVVRGGEDLAHARKVHERVNNPRFYGREGVALAEAGLIRYFQPKYNQIFKDNFPDPNHVSLAECLDLDLHTLVVEFQGIYTPYSYGTNAIGYTQNHFARYPLFAEDGRMELFDFS